jgi:hypothetical protein
LASETEADPAAHGGAKVPDLERLRSVRILKAEFSGTDLVLRSLLELTLPGPAAVEFGER